MEVNRIIREKYTIETMIEIYCKSHNNGKSLCNKCTAILEYVHSRIENCRFGDCKPICSRCSIYCYKNEMKESIKKVMRYSGARMLIYHPILTIAHFYDERKINKKGHVF